MILDRWIQFVVRHPIESIYFSILISALLILVMRQTAAWWKVRRLRASGEEARCNTCGYVIIRGSSTICSECGRDVRVHGLITSKSPLPTVRLGPAYLMVSLLGLPLGLWTSFSLERWHPFGWSYGASEMVKVMHSDTEMAARWCVQAHGVGRYFGRRTKYVSIYRNDGGDAQSVNLWIRPENMVVVSRATTQAYERLDQPLDRATIESFVRLTTGDAAYPRYRVALDGVTVARVSQEILDAAQRLARGQLPAESTPDLTLWVSYSLSDGVQIASAAIASAIGITVACVLFRRIVRILRSTKQERWRQEAARLGLVVSQLT